MKHTIWRILEALKVTGITLVYDQLNHDAVAVCEISRITSVVF